MSRVREIEDRKSVQHKSAVVDAGVAADIDDDFVRVELPFGMGKFAGGDGAVIDAVVIGAGLLDHFAGEGKGSG